MNENGSGEPVEAGSASATTKIKMEPKAATSNARNHRASEAGEDDIASPPRKIARTNNSSTASTSRDKQTNLANAFGFDDEDEEEEDDE